jgi:hypothetical protein
MERTEVTIEKFEAYFEKLEGLSSEELDRSAEKLVLVGKRNVALLIAHIAEMSRRKAELELGHKNLFEYCVRRLNLSEGSVALRLQVANVSRRFPQLLVALAENRISLTVAGLLATHLDENNVERLLSDCQRMTKRAVEEYLVRLRPRLPFAPSVRRRRADAVMDEGPGGEREPVLRSSLFVPAAPDQFNFRFAASRRFKEKLERLAEVLGVENPVAHMAAVLEHALDAALDHRDPQRKRTRRVERTAARERTVPEGESRPDEIASDGHKSSRYISSEVRERVHERAGYQCEYRSRDGTRCTARSRLEIEHERPFAIFRSHDERYLRLMCRRHNRFRAEQVYGAELIRARIDEARRQRELRRRGSA